MQYFKNCLAQNRSISNAIMYHYSIQILIIIIQYNVFSLFTTNYLLYFLLFNID